VLSSLRSLGNVVSQASSVGFISDNRAIYAVGKTLTLVERSGDTLEVLDRLDTNVAVQPVQISSMIWIGRPGTFIFPLDNNRVAVVTSQQSTSQWGGIDLYDVHQDRLTLSEHYPPSNSTTTFAIFAATGHGNRIWACFGSTLRAYQVDATTGAISEGGSFNVQDTNCDSLALSPDGDTLLMGTSSGLGLVDVSSADGTMTSKAWGLDGRFLLDVEASGDYIVAYELKGTRNADGSYYAGAGYGDVWILVADTLNPIASFPMNRSVPGMTPLGFTMAAGGLVLEQSTTGGCGSTVAEFYSLGPGGVKMLSQLPIIEACQNINPDGGAVPLPMTAWGDYAILEPTKQMVRIDGQSGAISPLIAHEQGSFERVRAAGPSTVEVHSQISTHLVDISKPGAPTVKAGGILMPNLAEGLRIEMSEDLRPSFLHIDEKPSSSTLVDSRPITSVYWANDSGGLPTLAGSLANDDGKSEWLASGGFLYQLAPQDDGSFHLTRFAAASISRENNQKLSPDLDQLLMITPTISSKPFRTWFGVDAQTGDLAIVEERSPTRLNWFTLGASGYELEWSISPHKGTITGFAVAGGRGVIVFTDNIIVVSHSGDTIASRVLDTTDITTSNGWINSVLAFTGKLIYVTARLSDSTPKTGVLVLRADDSSEVARYHTREQVRSMAAVGTHLVFGMASTLTVADPACP
jgi:hypothetical protein